MELSANLKNKHFLVVDDYESMRFMVSDHLTKLGATKVTLATSGNEAVQKITELQATKPVDFILTDLMMENGTGIELARAVRQKLGNKTIPIVMITSKAEVSYVLEAVQAGVNTYLIKPWQIEDFCKKINEAGAKLV